MDAAIYRDGKIVHETCDDPFPEASELRIRVIASGVCDTDERFRAAGFLPNGTILGHSIAGQVDAVGSAVQGFRKGDSVLVHFVAACGACARCEAGEDNLCEKGQVIGFHRPGGLASYVCVPASCAHSYPARISPGEAALIPCGYGTPFRALRHAGVKEGERVLLVGGRRWGLASIQLCRVLGARSVVVDSDDERLAQARALGADEVHRWPDVEGAPADVAIDFTGDPRWIEATLGKVRRGGRIVIVGRAGAAGPIGVELASFVPSELTLASAFLVRQADMEELVRWLVGGKIDPAPLLSHRATLFELDDAFTAVRELNPRSVMIDV